MKQLSSVQLAQTTGGQDIMMETLASLIECATTMMMNDAEFYQALYLCSLSEHYSVSAQQD